MEDSKTASRTLQPPPAVPPRISSRFSGGGGFGMPYPGVGMSTTYGSSPWMQGSNVYGGLYNGAPYGHYGGTIGTEGMAASLEPTTRPAFEAIESVVRAVGSVSILLESTYAALIASVRSVFAVGEQLARMKLQMGQLSAAFAITKLLRWLRNVVSYVIGRPNQMLPEPDVVWNEGSNANAAPKKPNQWPLLLYMAFLMGAPYLTWRFIKSNVATDSNRDNWKEGQGDHFVAQALYDFGSQDPEELSFVSGQSLRLAPKELQPNSRGWLLASIDGQTSGLVPANRIKILGRKDARRPQPDVVKPAPNPSFEDAFS